MRTLPKLGLLATLYFSQGLPFGFFYNSVPTLMRSQGYSLTAISLSTLMGLPWMLKFLWAPFVDRYRTGPLGPRRTFILPLQLCSIALLSLVGLFLSEEQLPLVLGCMFLTNLLAATQDIATDGLAVDLLEPGERGAGNGVQVAGYRVGMIAGGGAILIFYERLGWTLAMLLMAALLFLASLPLALVREPRAAAVSQRRSSQGFWTFFSQGSGGIAGAVRIGALLVAFKFGDAFGTSMLKPLFVDLGLGLEEVGWMIGTWGSVAGLLGALAGGALVVRLGRRRSLVIFGALQACSLFAYALVAGAQLGERYLLPVTIWEHVASGMSTAALFTCMMDWCRAEMSATDYTVQACLVVLATGVAGVLSGPFADLVGLGTHFAVAGGLAVMGMGYAAFGNLPFVTRDRLA